MDVGRLLLKFNKGSCFGSQGRKLKERNWLPLDDSRIPKYPEKVEEERQQGTTGCVKEGGGNASEDGNSGNYFS
eukprot:3090083-Ditylum_brightwellii.AAC.1